MTPTAAAARYLPSSCRPESWERAVALPADRRVFGSRGVASACTFHGKQAEAVVVLVAIRSDPMGRRLRRYYCAACAELLPEALRADAAPGAAS